MPEKIRYAQIGTTHAHASKIQVYRQSDDYEVVGVAEPDPQRRPAAENSPAYRDLKWMSVEQLLGTPGLQVVGVETHVRDLLKYARLAVDAGKHIHLDKPAGAELAPLEKLLDEAARQHLAVQMGYMYRYNPAVVMLRELLAKGSLGEPFELHAVMSKQVGDAARRQLAEFRGGSMFELGCHLVDLVVGLLGPPRRVHSFPRQTRPDDPLRDNILAVFEYPRATATIRSSVVEVNGFARRHLVLCGTEGTMHIQPLDNPSARLTLSRAAGKHRQGAQDVSFPKYVRYVDDAAELARIVRHQQDPRFSYDHDLAVQRAVLQASAMEPPQKSRQ